jgi:endonuclease/exonuclease/phosphatase family metal-dependent hydrolase
MKPYQEYDKWIVGGVFAQELARNALCLEFEFGRKKLWSINTHMAWGPTPIDEPYKVKQALKLQEFVKRVNDPFVLSGDFNVTKDSEIVRSFAKLGVNHAVFAGLTNTLNPRLHRAPQLFPPGLAVDFIYTSFGLDAYDFELVDSPDLSDHYGLKITIEFED